MALKSVQAQTPGRILLSDPRVARIPHIFALLNTAGWTPHRKTPHSNDAIARVMQSENRTPNSVWFGPNLLSNFATEPLHKTTSIGIAIDTQGSIYDARHASDLEQLLETSPICERQSTRAEHLITQLTAPSCDSVSFDIPKQDFVLVLDQAASDPSLKFTKAPKDTFKQMLAHARSAHPQATIIAYAPDGDGYLHEAEKENITALQGPAPLHALMKAACAIYTVTSPLGFTAILHGHHLTTFGQPWYAGWGLSKDHASFSRRTRPLTAAQLAAIVLFEYTHWYDPICKDLSCVQGALAQAQARERASRDDSAGYIASNILRWKRPFMRQYFGQSELHFTSQHSNIEEKRRQGLQHITWGAEAQPDADLRIEDGFLRSRGLGAALVRPLSLIMDPIGIYFDPTKPSQMECYISNRTTLNAFEYTRIHALTQRLIETRLSKYNVGRASPDLPDGFKILIVGQVEDDASIRLGAGHICTNTDLILAAKAAHPNAVLIFKPHPDVEAGLRKGKVLDAHKLVDVVASNAEPITLLEACDHLWTMTSLLGFEALLRGVPVTCTGMPFYAGWGLTNDIIDNQNFTQTRLRRSARPSLMGLAYAALIDAPRYFAPKTGTPISPEQAIEILNKAPHGRSQLGLNLIAKIRQARARLLKLDR